jgi:hypothetical protein
MSREAGFSTAGRSRHLFATSGTSCPEPYRRLIMFKKLVSGFIGAAFMVAVGTTAMVQNAHAAPWCYKTGPNTVQCTR